MQILILFIQNGQKRKILWIEPAFVAVGVWEDGEKNCSGHRVPFRDQTIRKLGEGRGTQHWNAWFPHEFLIASYDARGSRVSASCVVWSGEEG